MIINQSKRKKIVTLILMITCSLNISAEVTFKGKIMDEKGEAAIGTYIYQQDDIKVGTITKTDGSFNLEIDSDTPVIVIISSLGYQKIEVKIDPETAENNIILKKFNLQPAITILKTVEIEAERDNRSIYKLACNRIRDNYAINCFGNRCSAEMVIVGIEEENENRFQENTEEENRIIANPVLNVYPNPARELLSVNIKLEENIEGNYNYVVTDLSGKIVLENNFSINGKNNTEKINVSKLSPGFYTVMLILEKGEQLHKKFVKR